MAQCAGLWGTGWQSQRKNGAHPMADRNTILGWTLGAGIVALGLGDLTHILWEPRELEKEGYAVVAAAGSGGGAAAAGPSIETMLQTADASAGGTVFQKCAACHTVTQGGANGIGPNLYGVVGEPMGQGRGGYAFSEALKTHGGNWDFTNLNEWLTSPRRFANGTKMSFAGLSNPQDRANVIAYLNQQGSGLPMPPPPPAAPAGGAAAAPAAGAAAAAAPAAGAAAAAAPAAGAAAPAAAAAPTP